MSHGHPLARSTRGLISLVFLIAVSMFFNTQTHTINNPIEICENFDPDCEGLPLRMFFPDVDGDGSGVMGVQPVMAHKPPSVHYVTTSNDCDDTDPRRFMGHPEVCDGIDNDCDGRVDAHMDDGNIVEACK